MATSIVQLTRFSVPLHLRPRYRAPTARFPRPRPSYHLRHQTPFVCAPSSPSPGYPCRHAGSFAENCLNRWLTARRSNLSKACHSWSSPMSLMRSRMAAMSPKGERGDSQMGQEGGKSPIPAVFLRILGVCMSLGCFAPLGASVCGAHNRP